MTKTVIRKTIYDTLNVSAGWLITSILSSFSLYSLSVQLRLFCCLRFLPPVFQAYRPLSPCAFSPHSSPSLLLLPTYHSFNIAVAFLLLNELFLLVCSMMSAFPSFGICKSLNLLLSSKSIVNHLRQRYSRMTVCNTFASPWLCVWAKHFWRCRQQLQTPCL